MTINTTLLQTINELNFEPEIDDAKKEWLSYLNDQTSIKLKIYQKLAPLLEKNLIKIANKNKKSGLLGYYGFTDDDLTIIDNEKYGFDLYSIETIHWICLATGWVKQNHEITVPPGWPTSYIEIWAPPSSNL